MTTGKTVSKAPNGVEKPNPSINSPRSTLEVSIVHFLASEQVSVTSDEVCWERMRLEFGHDLPADRVSLALGFISASSLISYSESTGQIIVDTERMERFLSKRIEVES